MNNKRLIQIVKNPGIASEKEIKLINDLSREYSYSPFLKVLQARLDNLHDTKDKSKSLTKAAIYIADRSILKEFMSKDVLAGEVLETAVKEKKEKIETPPAETAKKEKPQEVNKKDESPIEASGTGVEEDTKADLTTAEEVPAAESDQEVAAEKDKEAIEPVSKDVSLQEEEVETPAEETDVKPVDVAEDEIKEGEESIGEKIEEITGDKELEEDAVETEDTAKTEPPKEKDKTKKPKDSIEERKIEEVKDTLEKESDEAARDTAEEDVREEQKEEEMDSGDSLSKEILKNISELQKHKASLLSLLDNNAHAANNPPAAKSKKSKKKDKSDKKEKEKYPDYEEEDPEVIKDFLTKLEKTNPPPKRKLKKEEQEKLIEKFIKSDPQMQKVRSSKELTEKKDLSAHSVKFRDDIISENLANIMIRQGKLEKAIDIYKKLIWKFPQKKAYFATQIEELKKKLKK